MQIEDWNKIDFIFTNVNCDQVNQNLNLVTPSLKKVFYHFNSTHSDYIIYTHTSKIHFIFERVRNIQKVGARNMSSRYIDQNKHLIRIVYYFPASNTK